MTAPRRILLGLLLAAALWVRLDRLAVPSFDIDEYIHVYAAQSLNTTGQPTLPSGNPYGRALPYTWLVAQSFRVLGVSEFSARLPSVLLDLVALALIYLIASSWFGPGAGVAAAGVMAFAPWWIMAAKNCRMYPLFHCLYLLGAWSAWQALEGDASHRRRWGWAILALGSGMLAIWIHRLAMTLAASVGVFVLGMACATRKRQYCLLAAVGLGGLVLAGLGVPGELREVAQAVNHAPIWAQAGRHDWGYYARTWWALYPALMLLYPAGLVLAWRKRPALAWLVACLGLVPFALHSIVFDWKMVRYAIYLLPWLVMPSAAALVEGLGWLARRRAVWAGLAAAGVVAAAAYPWLGQATTTVPRFPSPTWRDAYAQVRPALKEDDVIMTSMPLATLYYLGRPASYVTNNVHIKDAGYRAVAGSSEGLLIEGYGGRPMVTNLDELRRVIASHPRGWILIDAMRFGGWTITAEMADFIAGRLQPVRIETAPTAVNPVKVYRWDAPLHEAMAGSAPSLALEGSAS